MLGNQLILVQEPAYTWARVISHLTGLPPFGASKAFLQHPCSSPSCALVRVFQLLQPINIYRVHGPPRKNDKEEYGWLM